MRTVVAVLLALSTLAVALPVTTAANECATNAAAGRACLTVPVNRPSTPFGPQPPDTPYWDVYYVFVNGVACATDPFSVACRGQVAAGSGIPHPTGGAPVGVGFFGALWQETNGCNGLQRITVAPCFPDRIVLV